MQDDDNRQKIPVERAEPPHQALDRELHYAELRRRQTMPYTAVAPQFSEPPDNPSRWLSGYVANSCLVPAVGLSAVVLALVVLSLFLPPVSVWDEIETWLNEGNSGSGTEALTFTVDKLTFLDLNYAPNAITSYGLTLRARPADLNGSYGLHVEALTPADYLAGSIPAAGWHCPPALPAGYALASRVYSITQSGVLPTQLRMDLTALPDSADPGELALHVWHADRAEWVFMPATPAENPLTLTTELAQPPRCAALFRQSDTTRYVGVALDITDNFDPNVMAVNMRLYTGRINPTITGALNVLLAPGFKTDQGYEVIPLVQNVDESGLIDVGTVVYILSNPGLRLEHARQIAAFVLAQDNYAGAAIDYRDLPADQRANYTAFLRDLAQLLHREQRTLTVILPAPEQTGDAWQSDSYDWIAVGHLADRIVLNAPLNPRLYVQDGQIDDLLAWVTTHVIRSKVLLGVDALSVADYGDLIFAPITLRDALAYLGDIQLSTGRTAAPGATVRAQIVHPANLQAEFASGRTGRFLRYFSADEQILRTIWITDTDALNQRIAQAAAHHLGGIFVWHLMSPHTMPDLPASVLAYKLDQPTPAASYAPVMWRVFLDGIVVMEDTGQLDDPFSFQPTREGTYHIVAQFASGALIDSTELIISGPAVEPTPLPTEAPLPTFEPTQTPESIQEITASPVPADFPTATPPPGITPLDLSEPVPTVDPALLADALATLDAGFEAGAQIGGMSSSILQVGRMRLTWVKIDVRYLLGQSPAFYERGIAEAQANGFKVLLNVTGDPFEFMSTDRALYLGGYVQFVGELAALGADGIEVWYGMNGRMTPDEYVQMLGYAYHAIKTANPDTLVITGALRPAPNTDNPDEDDTSYYVRLGEANVALYADCIGVAYTLGTVPVLSTSGDPRGDYPGYYVLTLGEWAARAAQHPDGSRRLPLCFTRFGYLSPEGYDALPDEFAWAQSITAAQQAEWLTEAIRISEQGSQQGQVRLLIIWSLDAAYFGGGSPEEGYAIIRPDGSCPTCEAVAAGSQ